MWLMGQLHKHAQIYLINQTPGEKLRHGVAPGSKWSRRVSTRKSQKFANVLARTI